MIRMDIALRLGIAGWKAVILAENVRMKDATSWQVLTRGGIIRL